MSTIPLPSLSRSDLDFWPTGGYWRGSVWMPTTYMTIKALDARGEYALARKLARQTVLGMFETYCKVAPHTIWECYSPTEAKPGTYAKKPGYSRTDFCGWSALGPISLFIEDVIGVKQADAFANRLVCDLPKAPAGRVGVENYRFGRVVCDIVATAGEITVSRHMRSREAAQVRRRLPLGRHPERHGQHPARPHGRPSLRQSRKLPRQPRPSLDRRHFAARAFRALPVPHSDTSGT